ncbi:urease subunit beta [Staphylococcus sp. ACRSN]|uniref:urease subunit beta n=1 Tax=Staphylococcus sp. ACRSN TaxID=2918214 RepID=UPI001EF397C2|nr:urease subunit beta [Staphylococcus sp. ACRSN]MCG7339076.1 urease subunit beta [Staphylococcus sp. ACRSN]
MKPGEIIVNNTNIEVNKGLTGTVLNVKNTGDRPIQVGSHYHFFEANPALQFDREKAYGKRLDIPAGAAVRFEPGDEKEIQLVPYRGNRKVYGFHGDVNGTIDESRVYQPKNHTDEALQIDKDDSKNVNKESGYKS